MDSLETIMEELIETFSRQVLNEKSVILGSGEMADSCKIVARALEGLSGRKRMKY